MILRRTSCCGSDLAPPPGTKVEDCPGDGSCALEPGAPDPWRSVPTPQMRPRPGGHRSVRGFEKRCTIGKAFDSKGGQTEGRRLYAELLAAYSDGRAESGSPVTEAERQLSDVLSEFARTMVTEFPIQGILEHLVLRIVDVLPISAAGVTLISLTSAPHYLAASNPSALKFEELQIELGEGPCFGAFTSDRAVVIPDLRFDEQFRSFSPRAFDLGLAAVFTFPLRQGAKRLGALDLYRDAPGRLNIEEMATAQTLADVTSAYLVNAQGRADLEDSSRALPGAGPPRRADRPTQPRASPRADRACHRSQRTVAQGGVGPVHRLGRLQEGQ